MQWNTPTKHIKEKTKDWFASVIVIAGSLMFIAILLGNYVIAALVLAITVALIIVHSSPIQPQNIELRTGGILVDRRLYPWETIESFAIQEYFKVPRLVLKSKRSISPIISIPIDEDKIDIEELRSVLEEIIPEENIHEPFLVLLLEKLGLH